MSPYFPRGNSHYYAYRQDDFTHEEYRVLTAAAPLSDGQIIPPIALCEIESRLGMGHVYSQPFLADHTEVNPFVTPTGILFMWNDLSLPYGDQYFITHQQTSNIISQVVRLVTSIYIRSGKKLLFSPSLPAGDILADEQHTIKCVGILNMLDAHKFAETYSSMGPSREESDLKWFCFILNKFVAQGGLNIGPPLTKIGFQKAFTSGIVAAYDTIYGQDHTLTQRRVLELVE